MVKFATGFDYSMESWYGFYAEKERLSDAPNLGHTAAPGDEDAQSGPVLFSSDAFRQPESGGKRSEGRHRDKVHGFQLGRRQQQQY